MKNPISGPSVFAFFMLGFVLFLGVAINPQRTLKVVLFRDPQLSQTVAGLLRVVSGINAAGIAVLLVWYLWAPAS